MTVLGGGIIVWLERYVPDTPLFPLLAGFAVVAIIWQDLLIRHLPFLGAPVFSLKGVPASISASFDKSDAGSVQINWNDLAKRLGKLKTEHSYVHILFTGSKRPVAEKLKATFDLAGWRTSIVPSAFDEHPQGGFGHYYSGTEVKGLNRVFVDSLAGQLVNAGFKGVFTTIQKPQIKSDHPKWERVQHRVQIMIGHDELA